MSGRAYSLACRTCLGDNERATDGMPVVWHLVGMQHTIMGTARGCPVILNVLGLVRCMLTSETRLSSARLKPINDCNIICRAGRPSRELRGCVEAVVEAQDVTVGALEAVIGRLTRYHSSLSTYSRRDIYSTSTRRILSFQTCQRHFIFHSSPEMCLVRVYFDIRGS